MSDPATRDAGSNPPAAAPDSPRDGIWAGLIGVTFVASIAIAYRPELDSPLGIALAAAPWAVLAGMVGAWAGRPLAARLSGMAIAIAGWAFLMLADDSWILLSFALYGLCFIVDSTRLEVGMILAAIVSAIWVLASLEGPTWTVMIPIFVFTASSTIAFAIDRIGRLTAKQAALIRQLEATQSDLAASERSRGILEERTRIAGEIHDTLAQGFASIVLLARAGTRQAADSEAILESIEGTAQENLDTARRLVESSRPGELEALSLPDALRRYLKDSLPEEVDGELEVRGRPRPLPGATETVLLRTAQEGLRNAYTHAQPKRVDVTLAYLDGAVTLGVRDDGIGFVPGHVHDRGSLTGGQGLTTLARRVEALAGHLKMEAGDQERGSVLTVRLPTES